MKAENLRFIKFDFSFCGFSYAVLFKEIDADDVLAVEKFVQYEMKLILSLDAAHISGDQSNSKIIISELDAIQFYGEYTSNPGIFNFSIVEKKLIELLVTHVKYVVDSGGINSQLTHFTKVNSTEDQIQDYLHIGNFFGASVFSECEKTSNKSNKTVFFLNKLLEAANQNVVREKHGYRFNVQLQQFATYIRMISGPLAYETLQTNLECALPTLQSVNRYIRRTNCHIVEGVLRCEELRLYLEERDLPLVVSLSEDATRIEGRIQYDSKTNQLIGFVLPINEQTGMPIPHSYKARDASEIFKHFASNSEQAHFVNVIMAQPIGKEAPFCMLIFGSNGNYTAMDVSKRWLHIIDQLKAVDIKVLTISSDSDPKYNAAMRQNSGLGLSIDTAAEPSSTDHFTSIDWFSCGNIRTICQDPFYVQDTPHIGTKMRNFLLKTRSNPEKLPFGNTYFVNMHHLCSLLDFFSKADHLLCATTLNPIDRQNYSSVLQMCSQKVSTMLRKNIVNSEGTAKFLDVMRDVIDAYMDYKLSPLQRIRKMWYSLFILRIWREYVISKKKLTLKDNFLTLNCYTCIELNAHSLVLLIVHLKKVKTPELFAPMLYSSQPCESTFRIVRSYASTYSTVVNCSVKEILDRLNKVQLQSDIATHSAENFSYPKLANKFSGKLNDVAISLPTLQEMYDEIEKCKMEAIEYAIHVGLINKKKSKNIDLSCKVVPYVPKQTKRKKRNEQRNSNNNEYLNEILTLSLRLQNGSFKNYSDKFLNEMIPESGPYVEVNKKMCSMKERVVVKKTFLSWLLRSNIRKLSSDRLERVKSKIKHRTSNNFQFANTCQRKNKSVKPYRNCAKY